MCTGKKTERAKEERYTQQYIRLKHAKYVQVIHRSETYSRRKKTYEQLTDWLTVLLLVAVIIIILTVVHQPEPATTFAALSSCDARCIRRSISNRSWFNRFGDDFFLLRFIFMFLSPFDVVCMLFRFNFLEDYVDMQTSTRNENYYESDEAKMRAQLIT